MDPIRLFGSYPTVHLTPASWLALAPGMDWSAAKALLSGPLASLITLTLPSIEEANHVVGALAGRDPVRVADLLQIFPQGRPHFIERGLLWLAKFGVLLVALDEGA